ncbi:T9SS type B sorting domain-containing protein [uncultured Algibacter sp.]|uniref:T9SS type B sorting domain-containing protein n=1 Tax=uncultured Algibacter sp. TaxID=298659 RepID=UPI0032177909
MKKTTFLNNGIVVLLLLVTLQSFAQNFTPFGITFDQDLKGDMLLIGNNIVGPNRTTAFNNNFAFNHQQDMQFIDIDGDDSTFASSSADLVIPNPECFTIVHAGLYWAANTRGTTPITNVRFRGPSGGYNDVVGSIIYDSNGGIDSPDGGQSRPYACFADVTTIVQGLATSTGTYTIADVSSRVGRSDTYTPRNGTGEAAGWSLFVVYEDPTMPGKSITSYNGFSSMSTPGNPNVDINITGFRTIPTGPVRANFAFAALEGDKRILGDGLQINSTTITPADRPRIFSFAVFDFVDNFFNSTISQENELPVNNRNPNSTNTLGFDTGIIEIDNFGNPIIDNGDTSAVISLSTTGDTYFPYFTAFAVEIIEPDIVLTKIVVDEFGTDIGGDEVSLGQELNYVIGFQNTGNDNATDFIIRDILPVNVVFDFPADLDLFPPGVGVRSYDPATREIIFEIDNAVVEVDDPLLEIRFRVEVVASCSLLDDACSNIVENRAFSEYRGTINDRFIEGNGESFNTNTGCLLVPRATNVLTDLDDCIFTEEVILCGDDTQLVAANGYDTYSWSRDPSGTPEFATGQTITVTETGTYYVRNNAAAPCQSITQVFEVITFGADVTNPVIPFADQVVICPNDGKELPNIFLCGDSDFVNIETGITDASSIIWEVLDEASCDPVGIAECANESSTCNWNELLRGPDFTADTAGQYRLTINYTGGCFNQFFFNVFENVFEPTFTSRDIICTRLGEIVVLGVPSTGYEFSLDGTTYQDSNVFSVGTAGNYTVSIRQQGIISTPCIFTIPNVQIRERDFTVSTTVNQPLCNGDMGNVVVAANDVRPQYFFSIYNAGGVMIINSVGPIDDSSYTFEDLNPGMYQVRVSTQDGCMFSEDIEIINPPRLSATVALTTPLTPCESGLLTVTPQGGTAPYGYFVNGATTFQTTPEIIITTPGRYTIRVVDFNNCETTTFIDVEALDAPVFNVTNTNVACYNENTAQIDFNVTDSGGFTLEYSINGGTDYVSNSTFSNLGAGTYETIIRYTITNSDGSISECFSTPQNVTITEPDAAITAASGVSELAGCGPLGEGRVRITNPQGGTPFPAPNFYEYSFDNQATWVTTNEQLVLPGTYTFYVRDLNGCIYETPQVVLETEPVAPTITIDDDPEFNCDGTATSTVVVSDEGSGTYEYTYFLDGVENTHTDPRVFLNVPTGPHTITVGYTLINISTFSNLLNETFGYGNDTTSPGINTMFYCFDNQQAGGGCRTPFRINDGEYSVTSEILQPFGSWTNPPSDHTPATIPPTPDGRFLVVNIGATIPTSAILYEKQIDDIIPNRPINFEFFARNLSGTGSGADPDLTIALLDASGTEISSFSTGSIPKSNAWESYPIMPITLNPGANTSLRFVVRSNVQVVSGNDVAIDDIRVFQIPIACASDIEIPFVIPTNNAFTAQVTNATDVTCQGADDGTITIAAQNFDTTRGFDYSLDGGTTWITQLTSPFTITSLANDSYEILVRYDDSPTTCSFTLNQDINTPNLLEVNASGTPVTCLTGSTVTATATGGTEAYTFTLLNSTTLALISTFPANGILPNVPAGSYIVRVTDANSCEGDIASPLVLDAPTNPTATVDATSNFCDPSASLSIVVNASDGEPPYQYNIDGGAFGSSNTFAGLIPGTYEINVRDAFGCTISTPLSVTVPEQLIISTVLSKELDCTATPDAEITGTISGGTSPYVVEVSTNGGTSFTTITPPTGLTFTETTATPGTYIYRITDANDCEAESTVIVNAIENPTATTTDVNPNCNGSNDGSVQIIPADGVGPYTFSFNGSAFTTTSFYDGLNAGTYPYEVRDSKNCSFSGSVILMEPTSLSAIAAVTPFSCNVTNTNEPATITLTATDGTPPYQYSFNGSGFSDTNVLTVNDNGSNQTITYEVRDTQGCIFPGSETLNALNPPTENTITSTPVTCNSTTSDVTVTSTTGTGVAPLAFTIVFPASATSNTTGATSGIFTGLIPDTYIFRVTDANGCYYEQSHTVAPVVNLAVSGTLISNVNCFGGNDGAVDFTVSNFASSYSYTINGGAPITGQTTSVINLTGLSVGNQIIVVTDDTTGCTDTDTVVVAEPTTALAFTTTETAVFCTNDESQITVTATGGTPNYSYTAVVTGNPAPAVGTYQTNNVITVDTNAATDLVWDVYVRDSNGCIETETVTIISNPLPMVPTLTVPNQCTVTSGYTITATGATGVAPLTYSIDGGASFQTSSTFTVNTPNTYTVTVRDGNGCTVDASITIAPALTASALLTKDITCSAPMEANIDVTIAGGTPPYITYEVSTDGGTTYTAVTPTPTGASFSFATSTAATYQFRITDSNANSCTVVTNEVTTNSIVPVTASNVANNPTCNGGVDGSIELTAITGIAPFMYSLDGGATFVSSNVFGGLTAATYSYVVRDDNGCDATGVITLNNPAPIAATIISTPIVCNVNTLGSFDVSITSGGVAPFTYTLLDRSFNQLSTSGVTPVTSFNFPGLTFGDYYITIIDANGCEYNSGIRRIETPPILSLTGVVDTNSCLTGVNYTVTTSGGAQPYIFSIFGQPGTASPPQMSPVFTYIGLLHNTTYFLQVEDVNNCISVLEVTTPMAPSTIEITATDTENVNCNGASDGELDFTVQNYDPTVTDINYEILDALSLNPIVPAINGTLTGPTGGPVSTSITNLPAGNYVLSVREATGTVCSANFTFQIMQPIQSVNASITNNINANCITNAQVTVNATGGTGPYTYQAGPTGFASGSGEVTSTNNNVLNLDDSIRTNWEILVIDVNGCDFRLPVTISRDAIPTLNPIPQQCYTGTPFDVTLSGTVAVGTPRYNVNGSAFQTSPTFTINAPGTFTFIIQDGNGCPASRTLVVEPQLLLDANLTPNTTCAIDEEIVLTATGGTGTYTYEVNFNGGGYVAIAGTPYTATADGTYQFRVTDTQNPPTECQAESAIITIAPRTNPTFDPILDSTVTCIGDSDGVITVTASGGLAPYQYSIDNGVTFQDSNIFSNLAISTTGGPYNVVVRDNNNCISTAQLVTITDPTPVVADLVLTQGLTCGTGNITQPATLTANATGGTGPYTYSFDGGTNFTSTNTITTSTAGPVTVFARDSNGCISIAEVEIVPALDPPTDLDFSATAVTCSVITSDVTLTTTGGIAALTYSIISPTTPVNTTGDTNGIYTGLMPNTTYLFEVTDANGCKYQESFTVAPVTNIAVFGALDNNVNCNGQSDGAITFTVSSFSGTYSYVFDSGTPVTGQTATTIPFTGLAAGSYTITITDEVTDCMDSATVVVEEPSIVTLTETPGTTLANCNVGATVTVGATGGTPGYTYAFVQDGVIPVASDYTNNPSRVLDPAVNTMWDVYVLDANDCPDMIDVTIATNPLPTVTIPATGLCDPSGTGDPFTFSIISSTGSPPLEYSIGSGFQPTGTFTVSAPGTYTVTVRDTNGCTGTSMPITIYPNLDLTLSPTLQTCTASDGVITVTGAGGSGNYEYEITNGPVTRPTQPSNLFNGLDAGTYTVDIIDTITNCRSTEMVTLEPATLVTFDLPTVSDVTCNGGNDGSITINLPASNDNPVYTYQIIAPTMELVQNSNILDGLVTGTYTVRVTSGRGCFDDQIVVVGESNIVDPTPVIQQYNCDPGTNGTNFASITINPVTGGSGTYTRYEFIDGVTTVQDGSSNTYTESDLSGGTYTINVYDDNGCLGTATAIINPFIGLDDITVTVNNAVTCTNDEDITVSVNTTGGTPINLEYLVEDVASGAVIGGVYSQTNATGIFTGLAIGNYRITVTNLDTDCVIFGNHFVNEPNTFAITIAEIENVTCFSDADGRAEITFVDRIATPTDESGPFNYIIEDASGITVASGSTTSAGPIAITNLASGIYMVTATLTNSPFCEVENNFTITGPTEALEIMETHVDPTCVTGNDDGSISVSATGGWPGPYEYQLERGVAIVTPYGSVSNFEDLIAGNYTVRVRDSEGCVDSETILLSIPPPITATTMANPTLLNCFEDDNATITVSNVMGGQGSNYTYTLNRVLPTVSASGPQTSPVFGDLTAGTYTVTIRDGFSCEFISPDIIIAEPTQIQVDLAKSTSFTCTVDAELTLTATGGTGVYEYSTTEDFATVLGTFATSTTFPVPRPAPGVADNYAYYVRDANSCPSNVSNTITVEPFVETVITLDTDASNLRINCAGDNNGIITAIAEGGIGNYIYTLIDADTGMPITGANQVSPGVFTELSTGNYQVRVNDGDCLEITALVSIENVSEPMVVDWESNEITCFGQKTGTFEILDIMGGTLPIMYSISSDNPLFLPRSDQFFDIDKTFDDLPAGNYQVIVNDELGCTELIDFIIEEARAIVTVIDPMSIMQELCINDDNAEFSVTITGGQAPYEVSLRGINGTTTTDVIEGQEVLFDGLDGGLDYEVVVVDSIGCPGGIPITLDAPVDLNSEVDVQPVCTGDSATTTVTVNLTDTTILASDIDYSLVSDFSTDVQSSNVFLNFPPGNNQVIYIRHSNGCIVETEPFDVEAFDPLVVTLEETTRLNEIIANAGGGDGNYTYEFTLNGNTVGTDETLIIFESGTYTVTVMDGNECVAVASMFFEFVDVCIPNYFTPNGDGREDLWMPGCTINYPNLTFDIFDRYGRKIAEYPLGQGWDGLYNGKELPSGDYWYILKLNDERDDREFVGNFTLYR